MFLRRIHITSTILAILLLSTACVKELDQFIPFEESISSDITQDLKHPSDTLTFTVEGEKETIVEAQDGYYFQLNADLFEYQDGSACVCEEVNFQFVSLLNKGDHLIYQIPTTSENQLLNGQFVFHIKAWDQQKELVLKKDRKLTIFISSSDRLDDLSVYYGEEQQGEFGWVQSAGSPPDASVQYSKWETSTGLITGYRFYSDQLKWISLQKVFESDPDLEVCLNITGEYSRDNSLIFALGPQDHTAIRFNAHGSEGFCANLFKGMETRLVGISKRPDGRYQLADNRIVPDQTYSPELHFEPKSLAEIKEFLQAL